MKKLIHRIVQRQKYENVKYSIVLKNTIEKPESQI